jgi:hypothetical protein
MADISAARAAVTKRILEGTGHASHDQRKEAFSPDGGPPLLAKVRMQAARISDEDVAAAKHSGLSEDQIFELVACAAIGQSTRQYESAMAALAEATKDVK